VVEGELRMIWRDNTGVNGPAGRRMTLEGIVRKWKSWTFSDGHTRLGQEPYGPTNFGAILHDIRSIVS
jgi:hypothetical protein